MLREFATLPPCSIATLLATLPPYHLAAPPPCHLACCTATATKPLLKCTLDGSRLDRAGTQPLCARIRHRWNARSIARKVAPATKPRAPAAPERGTKPLAPAGATFPTREGTWVKDITLESLRNLWNLSSSFKLWGGFSESFS